MSAITPQTDVYLLKVPLEIDNENQLTFSNATAQFNYFNGLSGKLLLDNFTYQRKDGVIRVPYCIDDIIEYNYVMYRNEGFSNKWFYAYITGMEFLNPNTTAVSIKTDVFQTWQFDLTYKQTFVEREHVNDDTVGSNTIEESLELGDYVINTSTTLTPNQIVKDVNNNLITTSYPIFFQTTTLVSGLSIASTMFEARYNNVFSGLYFFAVQGADDARAIIKRYADNGISDNIIAIFHAPKEFLQGANVFGELGYNIYIPVNSTSLSTLLSSTTITRPSTVNGYTPKNNKLFAYPFSYVGVDNSTGITATFRYEDFANATPKFYMAGAIGQGCTVRLCPVSYKSYTTDAEVFSYGVTGAKFPICAWAKDYYTNWVTQNAVNIGVDATKGLIGAAGNMMFGNAVGTVGTLVGTIGGIMGQIHQAQHHPDQAAGDVNSSDLLMAWQRYYTVNCMSVRAEVARCIDEYFSMFGYKVNRVKTPNVTGRTNWNYVKTVGCYIDADIPQEDLQEIKNLFDKGITFWHNPTTFRDYSQSNAIVTP